MKSLLFIFIGLFSFLIYAQVTPPVAPAAPAPIVLPSAPSAPLVQVAPLNADSVAVPQAAAPPAWASEVIVAAQKLPIVGPFVSKALMYLGIISTLLTAFVAFLLTAISALSSVLNLAGVAGFAAKLQSFKDGQIMYWLKYFSMFNAKDPKPKSPA